MIKRDNGTPSHTLHYEVIPSRVVTEKEHFYLKRRLLGMVIDYQGVTSFIRDTENRLSAVHVSGEIGGYGPFYRLHQLEVIGLKTNNMWVRNDSETAKIWYKEKKYPYMKNSVFLGYNWDTEDFGKEKANEMHYARINALPQDVKNMIGAVKHPND